MNKDLIKWKILRRFAPHTLIDIPLRSVYLAEVLIKQNIYPKYIAEIGVWRGHSTIGFLRLLHSIEKFYAIDPWISYEEYSKSGDKKASRDESTWLLDEEIFKDRIWFFNQKVKIIKKSSKDALTEFADNYLDFVFIDANHSYEFVHEDIRNWLSKVRMGGILSGHDIDDVQFPGVRRAVEDNFGDKWHKGEDNTWWIIKR